MAKGPRRRHSRSQREAFAFARDPLDAVRQESSISSLPDLVINQPVEIRSPLIEVEDLRTWDPDPVRMPKRPRGRARLVLPSKYRSGRQSSPLLMFNVPRYVMVCVRRGIRREVLHALKKTGRGSGRPGRRTIWSNYHC